MSWASSNTRIWSLSLRGHGIGTTYGLQFHCRSLLVLDWPQFNRRGWVAVLFSLLFFPIQSADVQGLSIHQSNRTPSLLIIKNEPHVALVTLVDVSGVIEHGNLVAYSSRPRCLSSPRSAITSSQSAGLGLAAIQSSRLVGSSFQPSGLPIQSAGVQRLSIHQSNHNPSQLIIKNEPHESGQDRKSTRLNSSHG